jgi:hypothetical protein
MPTIEKNTIEIIKRTPIGQSFNAAPAIMRDALREQIKLIIFASD